MWNPLFNNNIREFLCVKEYLLAAEAGDLSAVTQAVAELNANINCVDHMGRSALELALMGDHESVVEFLLPRSNLQSIEDALLYAIGILTLGTNMWNQYVCFHFSIYVFNITYTFFEN